MFVSNGNTVKLGDFGLSKALVQTSFASTYVGTPYYMSPEVMHKNSYDSKSDIWSLGCLIYELCAGIPPFHDAKSHSELLMLVRNGRIPPLPKGYSSAMSQTIKAMMNLNVSCGLVEYMVTIVNLIPFAARGETFNTATSAP